MQIQQELEEALHVNQSANHKCLHGINMEF